MKFSPSVNVDGQTYTPPGWLWVLAFAVGGCEWAIAETETPEFKAQMRKWQDTRRAIDVDNEIAVMEKRLEQLHRERAQLKDVSLSDVESFKWRSG